MEGESIISEGNIEKRAEELEVKVAAEADAAAKPVEPITEVVEPITAKRDESGKFKPAEDKKAPNDPAELRKWNTRVSQELAELRKTQEALLAAFNKNSKKPVDWKELAKDPAKLEKAIGEREKELVAEHESKFNDTVVKQTAEITQYEDQRRYHDAENYPRWAELKPLIMKLAEPSPTQPNGDPRVNFNQHPKAILDQLYELAVTTADTDPAYKKPEAAKPAGKTYTQEEFDAQVAAAKKAALDEQSAALRAEGKGAGVGSMGKGTGKGKPGEVDKSALWNMPINDLGSAIKKGTQDLYNR